MKMQSGEFVTQGEVQSPMGWNSTSGHSH